MVYLTELSLSLPHLPGHLENLRILQIGDLHSRRFGKKERMAQKILREGCDLLLGTGDLCHQVWLGNIFSLRTHSEPQCEVGIGRHGLVLYCYRKQALEVLQTFLRSVPGSPGCFLVRGNHDPAWLMEQAAGLGITILNNESRVISIPGRGLIQVAGVNGFGRLNADIPRLLLGLQESVFTFGLCHYPEMAESLAAAGIDLILSGHTHGGQFCLPCGKPILTHSRTGKDYFTGLSRIGSSYLYVTRGLGDSVLPIRLFCPHEIVRITLRKGPADQTHIQSFPVPSDG